MVLESRADIGGHNKPETYLLNLATGTTLTITNGGFFSVSIDRKVLAYRGIAMNEQGLVTKDELILANAEGQPLKTIPWDKSWQEILGWTNNQELIFHQSTPGETASKSESWLVLNPVNGQRHYLGRNLPQFPVSSDTKLPYWGGWYGVMYDPTLTRAIYPRLVGAGDQLTYGLWDVTDQKLVTSLESIYTAPAADNDIYPLPTWTPDGSQFVFQGLVDMSPAQTLLELYRVSRNGKVEQLTHLNTVAAVEEGNVSWSPNGRYVAMFLNQNEQQARVAVLDTTTLDIKDYCFPITYAGQGYELQPPSAIWSPDSTQLIVYDWYSKDHQRVLLVDIAKGFAAQIAQDAEPAGWMLSDN